MTTSDFSLFNNLNGTVFIHEPHENSRLVILHITDFGYYLLL